MEKNSIIVSKIKKITIRNFIINPNYEVILTPSTLVNRGLFKKDYRPYGQYCISEVGSGGWITHNEKYINEIGLVIHNDQVCWPPAVIIYYIDETKDTFTCKTYEEAESKRRDILASIASMGEKVVDI